MGQSAADRVHTTRLLTNDVVSKRILDECQGVVSDFSNELNPLRVGRVVDASLQDTTSVSVGSDFDTVGRDGIVDELVVLGDQPVQALLNDVIAVQVLDQADDVQAQGQDDRPDLLGPSRVGQEVNHLLNGSRAVHVERDADEVIGDGFANNVSLFVGRVFEELLTEVVAKGVCAAIRCGQADGRDWTYRS